MRPTERREKIESILRSQGSVSVKTLARLVATTESTIRRDLARLSADGLVARTYGGALLTTGTQHEASLREREAIRAAEKDAIGKWAAESIVSGETVIIDAGTTTGRLAQHLSTTVDISVITNSLSVVDLLRGWDNIELTVLGGMLRPISDSLIGPMAELGLSRLTADRVFLGADGVRADRGICEASPVQTRTKEAMIAAASSVYVVADSSKLGITPYHSWARLDSPWTLVTDANASEEQLAPFRANSLVRIITTEATVDPA